MTEISHLVVNGCSWTYGDELNDPPNEAWPALLAKKLNLPLVNIAVKGQSNPGIFRRTAEYLFANSTNNSKPFVIIAWSQNFRDEGWFEHCKGYKTIRVTVPGEHESVSLKEKAWLKDFNYEDHFRRSLLNKLNMINLLNSLQIPYIIGNYENSDNDFFTRDDVNDSKRLFQSMIDYVYNTPNFWKTPLIDFVSDCPKMPRGHEGPMGHKIIAENVYNFFVSKYPNTKLVESTYMSAKIFSHLYKFYGLHTTNPWLT